EGMAEKGKGAGGGGRRGLEAQLGGDQAGGAGTSEHVDRAQFRDAGCEEERLRRHRGGEAFEVDRDPEGSPRSQEPAEGRGGLRQLVPAASGGTEARLIAVGCVEPRS